VNQDDTVAGVWKPVGDGAWVGSRVSTRFPVYTRGNAGEVYPEVFRPLSFDRQRTGAGAPPTHEPQPSDRSLLALDRRQRGHVARPHTRRATGR
jgi:hypothetical protein